MIAEYQDFSDQLEHFLTESMTSDAGLVEDVSRYINSSGGKRIRPRLCYLVGRSLGCSDLDTLMQVSAIIEMIHTATLMHDDVVDQSTLRRGVDTINTRWGAPSAILVGDFIYSRSFQLAVAINNQEIVQLLAHASNTLAEGEVVQLMHLQQKTINEEEYFSIIYKKTGVLFAVGCQSAAILSGCNEQMLSAAITLGKNIGIAFQIIDDLLDYTGSSDQMGKQEGVDFYEGKVTLPLIRMLSRVDPQQRQYIEQQLGKRNEEAFSQACQLIAATAADTDCLTTATTLVSEALDAFVQQAPPSVFLDELITTIDTLTSRNN